MGHVALVLHGLMLACQLQDLQAQIQEEKRRSIMQLEAQRQRAAQQDAELQV